MNVLLPYLLRHTGFAQCPVRALLLVAASFVPLPGRDATTMVRVPPIALEVHILLTEEEFTTEMMVRECEAILDRDRDTAFIRIQFAVSLGRLNGFFPDGISNRKLWESTKERMNSLSVRYGELTSMKGNAVLRIRDGLAIKTIVIRGENPLVVSYDG
jgi:hypothetical protein